MHQCLSTRLARPSTRLFSVVFANYDFAKHAKNEVNSSYCNDVQREKTPTDTLDLTRAILPNGHTGHVPRVPDLIGPPTVDTNYFMM